MPFIAYFFVLVLTAVTAAVSLDYLTAPEIPTAKHDTAKVAAANPPGGNAIRQVPIGKPSRETTAQASNDGSDQDLTPVYPAAPGKNLPPPDAADGSKIADAKTVDAKTADAKPVDQPANAAATQPAMTQQASATPANAPSSNEASKPTATPVSTQASVPASGGACAIEACSSAYRSFRASDCTYQPYGGPRKMCDLTADGARQASNTPAAANVSLRGSSAMRSSNGGNISRVRSDDNLDDVVRTVRRLPPPSMYDDQADDGYDGGRVVVIQRDGPRAYGGARPSYGPRYIYEAR